MLGSPIVDAWFWLYFFNAVFLIVHEIDSAYWKEWELFKIPGGITSFLLIHIPLVTAILIGLIAIIVPWPPLIAPIFSIAVSMGGLFAFIIHMYFLIKGREEFKSPISIIILVAILLISIPQLIISIMFVL